MIWSWGADPAASGDWLHPEICAWHKAWGQAPLPGKCTMCAILTSTNGQDVSESPQNEIFSAPLKELLPKTGNFSWHDFLSQMFNLYFHKIYTSKTGVSNKKFLLFLKNTCRLQGYFSIRHETKKGYPDFKSGRLLCEHIPLPPCKSPGCIFFRHVSLATQPSG